MPLQCFGFFRLQRRKQPMPLSARSLHASGRISDKQMAKLEVLRGTKAQKSKMAPFHSRKKDEGHIGNKGIPEAGDYEINDRTVQDKGGSFGHGGKRSPPSKGGRAGKEGQFHVKHIDKPSMQHPKFPASGNVRASNPKTGNTRMHGKIPPQGPLYGGGGRSTQ
jgi:hypothetical protein